MIDINNIKSTVGELQGSGKTFAEFLSVLFKDKYLEIYLGDSYEEVSTEQVSTAFPAVICGKVISAYRECLIIEAFTFSKSRGSRKGNIMFLSERSIRALNELGGDFVLEDMLLRSRESSEILK